jgi:hypothetical protein
MLIIHLFGLSCQQFFDGLTRKLIVWYNSHIIYNPHNAHN